MTRRSKITDQKLLSLREYPLIRTKVEKVRTTDSLWVDGPLKAGLIRKLLVWDEASTSHYLNEEEFVEFYNYYLGPLFRFIYGSSGFKNEISSDNDQVISSKTDLINLFWLLTNCLEVKELQTGIRIRKYDEKASE